MKQKNLKQKDVWELIIRLHNEWKNPSYYNHVRTSIEKIERDNDVKVPVEIIHKLDKRYRKMRDNKSL